MTARAEFALLLGLALLGGWRTAAYWLG